MEAEAEGQGELEGMLCAIALQVAAIVEEVLKAGFQVEAEVGREIVLNAEAERRRPLERNIECDLVPESCAAVEHMVYVERTMDGQFHHGSCRGIEAEVGTSVPLPSQTQRDAEILKPLLLLYVSRRITRCIGGIKPRIAEACLQ